MAPSMSLVLPLSSSVSHSPMTPTLESCSQTVRTYREDMKDFLPRSGALGYNDPTWKTPDNASLRWLTATKPSEFKARRNMQAVRQTAMGSYLRATKNQASDKGRANSEASDLSRSGNPAGPTRVGTKKVPKRTRSPKLRTGEKSSIFHLPKEPIFITMVPRTVHHSEISSVFPPTCLKWSLDPFQAIFREQPLSVPIQGLKFNCKYFTYQIRNLLMQRSLKILHDRRNAQAVDAKVHSNPGCVSQHTLHGVLLRRCDPQSGLEKHRHSTPSPGRTRPHWK